MQRARINYLKYINKAKRVITKNSGSKIIHGRTAINTQIGVPELKVETLDVDYFVKGAKEEAEKDMRLLNKRFGDEFYLEAGKHKGSYRIKIKGVKTAIADYTELPEGVSYVRINGKRYADLSYFRKHIIKTLADKKAEFRHMKDKEALEKIDEYEGKWKDISNTEFKRRKDLQRRYGVYNDTDKDRVINWEDCFPFDPTRQGFLSKLTNKVKSIFTKKKSNSGSSNNMSKAPTSPNMSVKDAPMSVDPRVKIKTKGRSGSSNKIMGGEENMSIAPQMSIAPKEMIKKIKTKNDSINRKGSYKINSRGSVEVAKILTKEEINASNKLIKESKRNALINKLKGYYDQTVGKIVAIPEKVILDKNREAREKYEKEKIGQLGTVKVEKEAPGTGGKGTVISENKVLTDEELKKYPYQGGKAYENREGIKLERQIEQNKSIIEEKAINEIEKFAEKRKDYWEKEVRSGKIKEKEAEKFWNDEIKSYGNAISRRANEDLQSEIKPKIEEFKRNVESKYKELDVEIAKSESGKRFISSAITGTGLALMGPVGVVLGGLTLARTTSDYKEIARAYEQNKAKFLWETIPTLSGGAIGYKGGLRLKNRIEGGYGDISLAGRVSKIPKELEMVGLVEYMKNMKVMPYKKVIEVTKGEGKLVANTRGGNVEIIKTGESTVKATRTGKNWNEEIQMGADGVVEGIVKRMSGKNEYIIKYKILENGERTTRYFKNGKEFAMTKDKVNKDYGITEPRRKGRVKLRKDMNLSEKRKLRAELEKSEKSQKIIKTNKKSKFDIKGEIDTIEAGYKITTAGPEELKKMLLIAKKKGNKVEVNLIKDIIRERAKFVNKRGKAKDTYVIGEDRIKFKEDGSILIARPIEASLSPKLDVRIMRDAGGRIKAKYTKEDNKAIKTVKKINKVLIEDSIKEGKIYSMINPVTGLIEKIKIPEAVVKIKDLEVNGKMINLLSLPKEVSINKLRQLIKIGAVTETSVIQLLKNKENIIVRNNYMTLSKIRDRLEQIYGQKMNLKLRQITAQASAQARARPSGINIKRIKGPEIPLGKFEIDPFKFPNYDEETKKIKKSENNLKIDSFNQIRFNDPLEALSGKKKYSDKMNIKLTKRYGTFYS